MSILVLILSLNGSLTTVQIPLNVDVQTCETKSLPNARKRYSRPLIVESAKCFSTEE
jgi:hypothetical protein